MKFCPGCGINLIPFLEASAVYPPSADDEPAPVEQAPPPPVKARAQKYNPEEVWREVLGEAFLAQESKATVDQVLRGSQLAALTRVTEDSSKPIQTIVHIAFDRPIVPVGGALYRSAVSNGRVQDNLARLEQHGYLIEDGKVVSKDGVPVSPAWRALLYWGGDRQHKRWHMAESIKVNPSRNGTPLFMDENIVAFSAAWKDFDNVFIAFRVLFETMADFKGKTIAHPRALRVVRQ